MTIENNTPLPENIAEGLSNVACIVSGLTKDNTLIVRTYYNVEADDEPITVTEAPRSFQLTFVLAGMARQLLEQAGRTDEGPLEGPPEDWWEEEVPAEGTTVN